MINLLVNIIKRILFVVLIAIIVHLSFCVSFSISLHNLNQPMINIEKIVFISILLISTVISINSK